MVDRQSLHTLIDELPETQLDAARRMLEDLRAEAVALDDDILSPGGTGRHRRSQGRNPSWRLGDARSDQE